MARIKTSSRWLALGIAFVTVMAGTGAFVGAIVGLIMVLLTRVVLDLGGNTLLLMSGGVLAGVLTAVLLALFLMARNVPALTLRAGPVAASSESI